MASLIENMAPEYTTAGATAGNYYMHSKLLYLCKKDCSGLFDESNFEQVYLSDLLRGTANSNLGSKPVLLWTNPSMTSYFTAQTIALDLSDYEAVLIEFTHSCWSSENYIICSRVYCIKNEALTNLAAGRATENGWTRQIKSVTDSGITFNDAYSGYTDNVSNDAVIPYKIYGFKSNLLS